MKLSFWTIIVMAVSIAFGILSFAIFQQTIPTLNAASNYVAYKQQLQTEADKMPMAKRRVERATKVTQAKAEAWNGYVATRTPEADVSRGGISLAVNPVQLTVDTQKFRNSIQRAVNAQVKKGGIKVVQGPTVAGPTDTDEPSTLLADYYNYPGIKFPVVIFDLGQVTVTGTYEQITANVRSYKSMPHYLAVTDGLVVTGTSPNLTGTYNLSVVGFIRGKEIFPSALGATAVPAAGGRVPGMPGGPPPGMPPGAFPGGGRNAGPVSTGSAAIGGK